MEESREMTFPFLIFTGSLESHDTIYLTADKHIICDFETSLVESALALLATYYVFRYNYPPELTIFFLFAKMHFAYSKLPSSVISLANSVTGHLATREFRHQPTRHQDFYSLY